tara:strand:+ start:1745 stop:2638 length:894 start_codon:yes stop_codon:yes gene_type:complete
MATWTKEIVDLTVEGNALTIDNIKIDGTNIGHTDDTDLMSLANGALTVNGTVTATGNITGTLATAAQTNVTSLGTLTSLTVSGATQLNNTLTVGVDDTGYDVKFFGDTSGNYMLWDTSSDRLDIVTTHNNTALRVQSNATRSVADAPDIEIRKQSVPNDDDYLGSLKWISLDAGGSAGRTYAEIDCFVRDQDDNAADGSMIINALSHGTVTQGLKIRSTNNGSSAEVECQVPNGPLSLGRNTGLQGVLNIERKNSSEFGYIKMKSSDGTASYLFVANNGTLRIHSSIPTANTDGSAV